MANRIIDRIVFLDVMRIFAFISVLIAHKMYDSLAFASTNEALHVTVRYFAQAILPLCYGGGAGVVVFFLTSGYIITHVLQSESTLEFLLKRFFRIYPLFIVAVLMEGLFDHYLRGVAFPPFSVWVPRLLLIGDFFGTPLALGGVEWTLRLEIAFYIVMAIVKALGLFRRQNYLPIVFIALVAAIVLLPPFPSAANLPLAYQTIYSTFLFMGACVYLWETGNAKKNLCIGAFCVLFGCFLFMVAKYQPNWKEFNYGLYAVMIFLLGWSLRLRIEDGPLIRMISNMTFAVYLFHNWLWGYISSLVDYLGLVFIPAKAQILVVLFLVCFAMHKSVERYGLRAGKIFLSKYRDSSLRTAFSKTSEPLNESRLN
ncbi:acyltransferase family protein [Pseudomonas umsongensis]|uniref:acyltransferase family protein n=1 Tax=Pseudomonas umsongensis TaxID=198618 RepID=UPI00039E93BA|nr:acyltransferase [Pseudomonas umsongensis]